MNAILEWFREPAYLTHCQFCFEPKERLEVLIVSREAGTSICSRCARIAFEHANDHLKRATDASPDSRAAPRSQSGDGVLPAAPDTPSPEIEGRRRTESPPGNISPDEP